MKEEFTYLIKKSNLSRLDITPFVVIYFVIYYLSLETLENPLYSKFLYLIAFFIHGMVFLIGNWKVSWKIIIQYITTEDIQLAQDILIEGRKSDGSTYTEVCEKEVNAKTGIIGMNFQKKIYEYSMDKKQFYRVKPMIKFPIKYYKEQITSSDYKNNADYPANLLDFPLPNFNKIFKQQIMDPLNFFQLFSVMLWFFDDNFWHPIFTLVMVIFSIFSVAIDRMTSMMNLRSLVLKPQYVLCYRDGLWIKLESDKLRPGDIVSIVPSNKITEPKKDVNADDEIALLRKNIPFGDKIPAKMFLKMKNQGKSNSKPVLPCDLLILAGSCVVDESILTGESVPLIKDSIIALNDPSETLDLKSSHKGNILYCGTEVLQNFTPETLPKCVDSFPPNNGAIAYVLKTGFDTAKGKLARSVIFNNENLGLKNTEAFFLLGILLIVSIITSMYVLNEGLKDGERDKQKLFLRCIMIITSVVPPELPMIMNISINYSLMYLRKKKIFCTEPGRIPLGGRINVCAFDKTGTLTTDKLEIKGVVEDLSNSIPQNFDGSSSFQNCSEASKVILGGCHTLVVHNGELLGDPIERLFFENSEFKYNHSTKLAYNSKKSKEKITVKKVFQFRSDLKRMSTVCELSGFDGLTSGYYVLSKGAPEVIGNYLSGRSPEYDFTSEKLMKEGYRVLCLAYKKLNSFDQNIDREEAEKDLTFAGLLILSCPLKHDTPMYIKQLAEANYKNIMITGDNMYTAAKTGQVLNFGPNKHMFLKQDSEGQFVWKDIDEKLHSKVNIEGISKIAEEYCLCVEGGSMKQLFNNGNTESKKLFDAIIMATIIFARVSPNQKEQIIQVIKDHGKGVLMCGDGTNDVGALKKSDVGIALVGLKDEPTKDEKKKELERKNKLKKEAIMKRDRSLLEMLNVEDDTEFKSGDACIAAPFTNKFSNSLKCGLVLCLILLVVTIMRQGICTMTTTLQTYKILTLQSLIYAYCMSTLHLENLKTSDTQNTIMGVFGAYYFFQLSNSKPVRKLPKIRPEKSIFNWHFWVSVIGQAIILIGTMQLCLHLSKEYSHEDDLEINNEEEFEPTFRNSMMFLYELVSMFCISIFNHEGEPFMQRLTDKKGHLKYILAPLIVSLLITLDVSDDLNNMMEITLDSKYDMAQYVFFVLFATMTASCYALTRFIKKAKYGETFGYL